MHEGTKQFLTCGSLATFGFAVLAIVGYLILTPDAQQNLSPAISPTPPSLPLEAASITPKPPALATKIPPQHPSENLPTPTPQCAVIGKYPNAYRANEALGFPDNMNYVPGGIDMDHPTQIARDALSDLVHNGDKFCRVPATPTPEARILPKLPNQGVIFARNDFARGFNGSKPAGNTFNRRRG